MKTIEDLDGYLILVNNITFIKSNKSNHLVANFVGGTSISFYHDIDIKRFEYIKEDILNFIISNKHDKYNLRDHIIDYETHAFMDHHYKSCVNVYAFIDEDINAKELEVPTEKLNNIKISDIEKKEDFKKELKEFFKLYLFETEQIIIKHPDKTNIIKGFKK